MVRPVAEGIDEAALCALFSVCSEPVAQPEGAGAQGAAAAALPTARLVRDSASGQPKGYGFVSFATLAGALRAVDVLSGLRLGGQTLQVELAHRQGACSAEAVAAARPWGLPRGGSAAQGGSQVLGLLQRRQGRPEQLPAQLPGCAQQAAAAQALLEEAGRSGQLQLTQDLLRLLLREAAQAAVQRLERGLIAVAAAAQAGR